VKVNVYETQSTTEVLANIPQSPQIDFGVILPETEVESDMDGWYIRTFIPYVTAGKTYTVIYNGVPYECVGVVYGQSGLEGVGLGNLSLVGGENTGEPFGMLVVPKETFDSTGLGAVIVRVSGDVPRTVGIYEKASNVDLTGVVKSVNGVKPDKNGNVEIAVSGGATVETVEPAEDDIPRFFYGGALPQTKTDTTMPFRYISKTQDISGYCVTKAQGTSSLSYAKKNQTTKFYKDAEYAIDGSYVHMGVEKY